MKELYYVEYCTNSLQNKDNILFFFNTLGLNSTFIRAAITIEFFNLEQICFAAKTLSFCCFNRAFQYRSKNSFLYYTCP